MPSLRLGRDKPFPSLRFGVSDEPPFVTEGPRCTVAFRRRVSIPGAVSVSSTLLIIAVTLKHAESFSC